MPKNLDFKPQGSLTEMMKLVLGKDQQASFRVNALRMRNMVDVAPTQVTMQSHLQLLLAEALAPQHSGKDTDNFHTRSQPEVEGCGQCREGQQRPREDWKFTSRTARKSSQLDEAVQKLEDTGRFQSWMDMQVCARREQAHGPVLKMLCVQQH